MGKAKRLVLIFAIGLFLNSCAAYDNSMSTFKKTFPGRNDKQATTDNNVRR